MSFRSKRQMGALLVLATVVGIVAVFTTGLAGASVSVTVTSEGGTQANWKFAPTINAPWAQGGDDEILDAPDPDAAAICRSTLFNTANPYAPTTNVDTIVGDQPNNSGFSSFGCVTAQNETTVAVNPTNANNIVAGTNDYRVCCDFTGLNDGTGWAYYSRDGGATWANVQVPGLTAETGGQGNFKRTDSAGDPALAFGPDGTLYYANIVFSRVSPASGVAVSISKDGGATWGSPTMVTYNDAGNYFNDKEWIAAGPNGSVVLTWTRFNQGAQGAGYKASPIVMAVSQNSGQSWNRISWPVSDATRPYNQGSMPAFDANGNLYVAYEATTPESGYTQDGTVVARSTDLGQHFTQTTLGRVYDDNDCYPIYAGRQTLTGEHFRLNSYPTISVDPTNGHVAVTWSDDRGTGNCGTGASSFVGQTNAKTVLVTSNNGTSYTGPAIVSAGDTVFPSVAANNGKYTVSYYTRAYSPATPVCTAVTGNPPNTPPANGGIPVCLDYAARSSSDGFASENRLTTESSNPYIMFADGSFIGDYSQIALGSDGVAHPVWTDFRGNPNPGGTKAGQDAYTQSFTP